MMNAAPGRQHSGGQSPIAVSISSLIIKAPNSTYMSLSWTKLTEISNDQRSTVSEKGTETVVNTQNSLPYSTRVTDAEAHTLVDIDR